MYLSTPTATKPNRSNYPHINTATHQYCYSSTLQCLIICASIVSHFYFEWFVSNLVFNSTHWHVPFSAFFCDFWEDDNTTLKCSKLCKEGKGEGGVVVELKRMEHNIYWGLEATARHRLVVPYGARSQKLYCRGSDHPNNYYRRENKLTLLLF